MFSIRIQQYSIVNRQKKTSVSSLQINNIREAFHVKNGWYLFLFLILPNMKYILSVYPLSSLKSSYEDI